MKGTTAQAQWDAMAKAGIPERLRQQMILSPEANDPTKFEARVAQAAEMSALGRILGKSFGEDFDTEGCVASFVAHGRTPQQFREQAVRAMAEADEHVWCTPPTYGSAASGDVIAARAAQIDKLRKGQNRG